MSDCEYLETCPFFASRLENMPVLAEFFKDLYCRGQFGICTRYRVAKRLGSDAVPMDLFPNEEERVREILKTAPDAGGASADQPGQPPSRTSPRGAH